MSITIDRQFGWKKEEEELEKIKKAFSPDLVKVDYQYYIFDYACDYCFVELKSRRNTKDKYPDTMVSKNKIDYAGKAERPVFFCFSFTDGLYYWKYNEEDISKGYVKFRTGGRNDRGRPEYNDYAFINTAILNKIY
jgi:hypothetical protein